MAHGVRFAAVLMAAGAGSRMGHKPKSLLQREGEALIHRNARQLLLAGASPVVVVLGHYAQAIGAALQGLSVQTVLNPDPDQGLVSSQRLGLQAVAEHGEAVVMALADQPLVNAQDIQDLMHAFATRPSGTEMLFPWVHAQPGNPVLLSAVAVKHILQGDASFGCKEWRQSHPAQTHRLATDNTHFTTDLDHPQDVVNLREQHGIALTWPADWLDGSAPAQG